MSGIEHQILETLALVNENMVDAHLFEVNHTVLGLFHLILYGGYLGGEVLLTLQQTFEHTTRNVVSLLLDDFKILLNRVKFRLQNLLLHLRRLRYLAELVVRHDNTVIVVVLDLVEEVHAVCRRETLGIRIEDTGIGIGRLISHGNFRNIGFHSDNHRFIHQSETFHLMSRHAHYQGLASTHLMVAYSAAILNQHPYAILLRLIYGIDMVAVAQQFHVEVGKLLM